MREPVLTDAACDVLVAIYAKGAISEAKAQFAEAFGRKGRVHIRLSQHGLLRGKPLGRRRKQVYWLSPEGVARAQRELEDRR